MLVSTFKVIKAEILEGTRMCLGNRSPRTLGLSQIPCAQINAAKSNGIYSKKFVLQVLVVPGIVLSVGNTAENKINEVRDLRGLYSGGEGEV